MDMARNTGDSVVLALNHAMSLLAFAHIPVRRLFLSLVLNESGRRDQ
jgi:hypothetical protein